MIELRTYRIEFTNGRTPHVRLGQSPEGVVLAYLAAFERHTGIAERRRIISVSIETALGWRKVLDVAGTEHGVVTVAR